MIQSMTGFSNVIGDFENLHINLELRAVNHRYLDIQFKLPEELRFMENILRERIQANVKRGKIECRINIKTLCTENNQLKLNSNLLTHLIELNNNILSKEQTLAPLSVAEILKFPNIIQQEDVDSEIIQEQIIILLDKALKDFCASRIREGEKLKQHLLDRLAAISQIVENTVQIMPQILDGYYEKLQNRLKDALVDIQEDRIKQEFVLFMQKADVDEELSRLKSHVSEVTRILNQKEAVGKRLDFLMQELNREANTLGSKAISSQSTQASVELKVLIEQMREQIQNVE